MTKDNLKFLGIIFLIVFCTILFFDSVLVRCASEKNKETILEIQEDLDLKDQDLKIDSINTKIEDIQDSIKTLVEYEKIYTIPDVSLDSLERWVQSD